MIKMKKIFILCAVVLALNVHALCIAPQDFVKFYAVWRPEDEKVILMPSSLRLELSAGEREELTLMTRPKGIAARWESSDENICRIEAAGNDGCTLLGVSDGECTVTVWHEDAKAEVRVSVTHPAEKISLDRKEINLSRGESTLIRASTQGEAGEIDWQMTPEGLASLSFGGEVCRVKALCAGEFYVSATLPGGARAVTHVTVESRGGDLGYRVCVTLLFTGAAGLIGYAYALMRKNKKRGIR